jgi:hypothetical protein
MPQPAWATVLVFMLLLYLGWQVTTTTSSLLLVEMGSPRFLARLLWTTVLLFSKIKIWIKILPFLLDFVLATLGAHFQNEPELSSKTWTLSCLDMNHFVDSHSAIMLISSFSALVTGSPAIIQVGWIVRCLIWDKRACLEESHYSQSVMRWMQILTSAVPSCSCLKLLQPVLVASIAVFFLLLSFFPI